jgi:hypothetical protein
MSGIAHQHGIRILEGHDDVITSRVRILLLHYLRAVAPVSNLVFDQIERTATEYGVDPKAILWVITHKELVFRSMPQDYRDAISGAWGVFKIARVLQPGLVGKGLVKAYNTIMRTPVSNKNNNPFLGEEDYTGLYDAVWALARWAKTQFRHQFLWMWTTRLRTAAKDVMKLWEVAYNTRINTRQAKEIIQADLEAGLLSSRDVFHLPTKARIPALDVLRWVYE